MRRFLVFLLYDPDGFVDSAVLHTLRGLQPHVEQIFVVVNGYLQDESRERLGEVADEIFERDNIGFDVGAYRAALGQIGWDRLAEYDELLFVNYTFFGPITTFDELFERMDTEAVDFWGMTNHVAVTPHPIVGKGTMPEHLQSYWLVFRHQMFMSAEFKDYWASIRNAHSYNDVIEVFETEFTHHFAKLGFQWKPAFSTQHYGVLNASMEAPLGIIEAGGPMFKRRIFFHDVVDMDHRGVSGAEIAAEAIARGFPRDVIVDGIIRRTPARALSAGLGLLQTVPEDTDEEAIEDVQIVEHEGRPWKAWLSGPPPSFGDADILITTAPYPREGELSDGHLGRYRRAMSAVARRPNAISRRFLEDSRLGLVVPLTVHRGSDNLGHGWHGLEEKAAELADLLHLRGPLEKHSPLAPFMGIAAYRVKAFGDIRQRVERAGGWSRLASLYGGEDALCDILDLLAADIARTNGFLTAESARPSQLRVSQELLAEKLGAVAARFPPGARSPFLEAPIDRRRHLRGKIGEVIRGRSPVAAKVILRVEKLVKVPLRTVHRVLQRLRGGLS